MYPGVPSLQHLLWKFPATHEQAASCNMLIPQAARGKVWFNSEDTFGQSGQVRCKAFLWDIQKRFANYTGDLTNDGQLLV